MGNTPDRKKGKHPTNNQSSTPKDIFKRLRRAEIWMICLTALIVFVGGLQWDMMRRQLNLIAEANRRDQRAWVGSISMEPPVLKDANNNPVYVKEGLPAKFTVVFANFGKTPALKVKSAINAYLLPADATLSPDYNIGRRQSIGVLQPTERNFLPTNPTPTIFNASQISDMKSGKLILYLFGMITYEDIFKEPHCTTFCKFLNPSLNAFMVSNTYNQAD